MADEITFSGSLAFADGDTDEILRVSEQTANASGKRYIKAKQTIGTSEEAIILGEVTSPGWAVFINRDTTNFIELRVATGGAKFHKLLPGECSIGRLASGAQAPYAIADTGACKLEYLIVEA